MNSKKLYPKKRFGQHWLIDKKVLNKIKDTADLNKNDFILEIGPGKGVLTEKLLDSKIKRLHAVELDKDLIQILSNKFIHKKNFSLEQGDILKINLDSYSDNFTKVIGNIPYNITGPIMEMFIGRLGHENVKNFEKIIFLMQKEVADRIIANKGDSKTGALSTRIKLLSDVTKICDVPASSFNPSPKVTSSLLVFKPKPIENRLNIELEKCIDSFLRVAFNARRKKIRNTIKPLLKDSDVSFSVDNLNVNFDLRPQDLSIEDWIKIAQHYIKIKK